MLRFSVVSLACALLAARSTAVPPEARRLQAADDEPALFLSWLVYEDESNPAAWHSGVVDEAARAIGSVVNVSNASSAATHFLNRFPVEKWQGALIIYGAPFARVGAVSNNFSASYYQTVMDAALADLNVPGVVTGTAGFNAPDSVDRPMLQTFDNPASSADYVTVFVTVAGTEPAPGTEIMCNTNNDPFESRLQSGAFPNADEFIRVSSTTARQSDATSGTLCVNVYQARYLKSAGHATDAPGFNVNTFLNAMPIPQVFAGTPERTAEAKLLGVTVWNYGTAFRDDTPSPTASPASAGRRGVALALAAALVGLLRL